MANLPMVYGDALISYDSCVLSLKHKRAVQSWSFKSVTRVGHIWTPNSGWCSRSCFGQKLNDSCRRKFALHGTKAMEQTSCWGRGHGQGNSSPEGGGHMAEVQLNRSGLVLLQGANPLSPQVHPHTSSSSIAGHQGADMAEVWSVSCHKSNLINLVVAPLPIDIKSIQISDLYNLYPHFYFLTSLPKIKLKWITNFPLLCHSVINFINFNSPLSWLESLWVDPDPDPVSFLCIK